MTLHAVAADDGSSSAASLSIGGITSFSTVDWPGKMAAVAFLTGCPWRCAYCQNRILWDESSATSSWDELVALMESRRGLLDGVVFSGGEPLGQRGLLDAVRAMRDMGFEVGLHTGGAWPRRLEAVLPDLSWVGFDVKAPWDAYERVTMVSGSGEKARQSLEAILAEAAARPADRPLGMEARTTWHPELLSADDLTAIALELGRLGVRHWAVQAYRPQGTDESLPDEKVFQSDVPAAAKRAVEEFEFRGR